MNESLTVTLDPDARATLAELLLRIGKDDSLVVIDPLADEHSRSESKALTEREQLEAMTARAHAAERRAAELENVLRDLIDAISD